MDNAHNILENPTIDMTKMNLRPFEVMERLPSSYFAYDVAVTRQHDGDVMTYSMVEVSQADGPNFSYAFVFSQAPSDPVQMHAMPGAATRIIVELIESQIGSQGVVLICGLGGGLIHTQLCRKNSEGCNYRVRSIEPDSTVILLARRYFQFDGDVVNTTQQNYFREQSCLVPITHRYDAIYVNSFCQYIGMKAMDVFDDHETLDGMVKYLSPNGRIIVNCFAYLQPVDFSSLESYAASRKLNFEIGAITFRESEKIHNYVVILTKGKQ